MVLADTLFPSLVSGRSRGIPASAACGSEPGATQPSPMNIEPLLIVELALLGACTGFLAGLLGIGGGMLMVPFVTFILASKGYPEEYTVKMAVATSLTTICFTSLSSRS